MFGACNKGSDHAEQADTYTCPMHPTVVSNRPATCPVCGMDLVRKARPGEEVEITEDLAKLMKSPNEVVIATVATTKGEFKSMPISVNVQGVVTYDTRTIYSIPSRTGGRLEKVFLKYPFQKVLKGQKVAEIYSPELLTAQRELLYLIEKDPGNADLIHSAKRKLSLLGATQIQMDDIIKDKAARPTFSIFSPYDGYLIAEGDQAPVSKPSLSSPTMSGGMASSASSVSSSKAVGAIPSSSAQMVREGTYVTAGQPLFKIVNPSDLRIELDLPIAQSNGVNTNDEVELDLGAQGIVRGKVDFVQPFFTEGQEFVKLRLYIRNSDGLLIGQIVTGIIKLKPIEALWVPRQAVLDLGLDKIVFVKTRGVFKPKAIRAGLSTEGWIEIIQGLSSSDEIALNAQYLVDSEGFIKMN
jgi:Cu(I)/Ag(I) efflux system membrane fusion protein